MNFAQMIGRGLRQQGKSVTANPSMTDVFNGVARAKHLGTIMQAMPTGEVVIWVTNDETDPMKTLLSAALSIMVRRGLATNADKGVSIRRMMVATPEAAYYWKVTDNDGVQIAEGYATSPDDAATQMRQHLLPNL